MKTLGLWAIVVLAGLIAWACTWREGRSVWIDRRDGAAEAGTGCVDAGQEALLLIDAVDLYQVLTGTGELPCCGTPIVVDTRPAAPCASDRIPSAQCNPWDGTSLAESIEPDDGVDCVVLYDSNGESLAAVAASPPAEVRLLGLTNGWQGWNTCEPCLEWQQR
jgi:hypothetical protein